MLLDVTLVDQQVEVTAHRGRGQPQAGGEGGRGERPVLGDRLTDPVPGARLKTVRDGGGAVGTVGSMLVSDKHNISVT